MRRRSVGPFTEDRARSLEDLELLPPLEAVRHLAAVSVGADVAALVATGTRLQRGGESVVFPGDGPWAVLGPGGELLAVYEARDERAHPAVVLAGG